MSVNVNPPPQLKIPEKFFNDPEVRAFFEQQRTILFQLWNRTGGTVDGVDLYSDHVNLQNIGVNTHSQIDTHLALVNQHIDWTVDQGATDINTGNYNTDHTLLSNIGTNTHIQIDTHIADTDIHLTVSTTTALEDITNAINTDVAKVLGYPVMNTTTGVLVFASGSTDGDVWHRYDESIAHAPV